MSNALKLQPITSNIDPRISEKLVGYWERDEWYADDPEMLAFGKVSGRNAAFNFSPLPDTLRNEAKYFFMYKLLNQELSIKTALAYVSTVRKLAAFLNENHLNLSSFRDLDFSSASAEYTQWLEAENIKIIHNNGLRCSHIVLFEGLMFFYQRHDQIEISFPEGSWANDIWYMSDSNIACFGETDSRKAISFISVPDSLKPEFKYFFAYKLETKLLSCNTAVNYGNAIETVSAFLVYAYPHLSSFSEISYAEAEPHFKTFLTQSGKPAYLKSSLPSNYFTLFHQLCLFYEDFYDSRDEWEKDVWDASKLPWLSVSTGTSELRLDFTNVPDAFRPIVKRYIKFRTTNSCIKNCNQYIRTLEIFFTYIHEKFPEWETLNDLDRQAFEGFLSWFAANLHYLKDHGRRHLVVLRYALDYFQRAGYPEAPLKPLHMIFLQEDIPRKSYNSVESIKYIPEDVLYQFDANIENIPTLEYKAIAILLRASGWRIADVLYLKYDKCLDQTSSGWYLVGDIIKTKVLEHRVPITNEVAAAIASFADEVREKSTEENNPEHLLFARFSGRRMGKSLTSGCVAKAFNKLAEECNIVDSQGKVFHFKNHAFRHSKAVELINNGMNIVHVQKWLAHSSPAMTMRYAILLDTTMRKSWEEVMKNGLFRMVPDGDSQKIERIDPADENLIEWEYIKSNLDAVRLPLGYCMKPRKQECNSQLNPCLTCRNLCTTVDFIPQYEAEIQGLKALIETGKQLHRDMWVEKNEKILVRYESVLAVLKEGNTYHLAGKKGRENIG